MSDRLKGRTALVTGAGNGIGKQVAQTLASEGASVVVNDLGAAVDGQGRNSAAADDTVALIRAAGGTAVADYDSVAEPDGCRRAVATAVEAFGACDILIANAGALLPGSHLGIQADDAGWQQLVNLYLGQKFWLCREAVPGMLERGWGRVLFATSEISRGTQKNPLGAAVMNGAVGLMRDLANQHTGSGVTFNAYAPGAATRTYDLYKDQITAGLRAQGVSELDLTKHLLPGPELIAPPISWLCTDAAAAISGEVFNMSGGTLTRWTRTEDAEALVKGDGKSEGWTLDELDGRGVAELLPHHS